MQKEVYAENSTYEYIDEAAIKKISNKVLINKVQNTRQFLRVCETYLKDIKDDYSKKKIASLRVEFVRHQLELLKRECFAREIIDYDLNSYYSNRVNNTN